MSSGTACLLILAVVLLGFAVASFDYLLICRRDKRQWDEQFSLRHPGPKPRPVRKGS